MLPKKGQMDMEELIKRHLIESLRVKYHRSARVAILEESMVEYALMISLIAMIGFGAYQYMGAATTKPFCEATGALMFQGETAYVEWTIDKGTKKPHCYSMYSSPPLW
jgi:hypothetical protein